MLIFSLSLSLSLSVAFGLSKHGIEPKHFKECVLFTVVSLPASLLDPLPAGPGGCQVSQQGEDAEWHTGVPQGGSHHTVCGS